MIDPHTVSSEGYQWTETDGLQRGLPTAATVYPPTHFRDDKSSYDVIVIGAGYTGLVAARDLTLTGFSVLLLEARDRIGGRTWTAAIEGHNYELGGTYIHWSQPHAWREIVRYQMHKDVEATIDLQQGLTEISATTPGGSRTMSQDEQAAFLSDAFGRFMNVDEGEGKNIMPFPHNPSFVPDAANCDEMSLKDRLDQVQDQLTPEATTLLESFLVVLSGARLEDAGFYDLVRLWALCGYSVDGVTTLCTMFKLHAGQSNFARKFLAEALSTQRLSYAFRHPVTSIQNNGQGVEVVCTNGKSFRGKRVICTIPHNVLGNIKFSPPLSDAQTDVLRTPHVNRSRKIHAEVQPATLRTWMGINYPGNDLIHASGEAITHAGNARLVCFGAATTSAELDDDAKQMVDAVKALDHHGRIQTKRLVFTNWTKDEYARGGWSWLPPLMGTTRDLGVLREGHNNVLFANADWAEGWRGFIDGAIEEGTRTAKAVKDELMKAD